MTVPPRSDNKSEADHNRLVQERVYVTIHIGNSTLRYPSESQACNHAVEEAIFYSN